MSELSISREDDEGRVWAPWLEAMRASVHEHRHYLAFCICYVAAGWAYLLAVAPDASRLFIEDVGGLSVAMLVPVATTVLLWLGVQIVRQRSVSLTLLMAEARGTTYLQPGYIARVLLILFSFPFVLGTFLSLKVQIGRIVPFGFDAPIIETTNWLTGGKLAWQYLFEWLHHPWVFVALNEIYYLWFPVLCATVIWRLFSFKRPHLRLQFLLAFVFCWGVLGSLGALALSSAGPAFLPYLSHTPTPFDGLIAYLNQLQSDGYSMTALDVQKALWQLHAERSDLTGSGISAMPSIHVSMATMLAFYGWRLGRLAGLAYTSFAVAIFIGSILLAFHYALDGIVGAVAIAAIWYLCGHIAEMTHPREQTK